MNRDLHPIVVNPNLHKVPANVYRILNYTQANSLGCLYVEERVAPVALEGLRTHPRWKRVLRRCDYDDDDDDDDDDDS